ncbi:MAG: DegT/DnrJ/EryC1/StrS family aminotransferase [Polyangiaceae bacterium]|nr:DegT/DnrJ/EryC1/StrS family aminotransferase [Polyangiaceae bacterium]
MPQRRQDASQQVRGRRDECLPELRNQSKNHAKFGSAVLPPKSFIPVAAPVIGDLELKYVTDAVRSGWVSSIGPYLERFERGFAAFCGARHGIAVCNGTVAIHLALRALGVGPGDEVIVPNLTFAATAHAVLETGAEPVFVDASPESWCLDPVATARALSPKTRAIIPVHLYGHPADMTALAGLATEHGLHLVEDAAEAHGARVGVSRVGALGTVGAFSFYGNKLMTTGEGGMLVTNDDALAERIRFLKDHGMSKERRYFHTELAFNYRMTNVQAALGVAQLEQVERFLEQKRRIIQWYRQRLSSRTDVQLNPSLDGYENAYWMASVVLGAKVPLARDAVASMLKAAGIDTRPFFVPMTELPHLSRYRAVGVEGPGCPVAARLGSRGLNLPSGCSLSEADVDRVCEALVQALSLPVQ